MQSQILSQLITFAYVLVLKCSRFAPVRTRVFSTRYPRPSAPILPTVAPRPASPLRLYP